jgi:hypothetical protein
MATAMPAHVRKLRVNERPTASSRESRRRRNARRPPSDQAAPRARQTLFAIPGILQAPEADLRLDEKPAPEAAKRTLTREHRGLA